MSSSLLSWEIFTPRKCFVSSYTHTAVWFIMELTMVKHEEKKNIRKVHKDDVH